MNLYNILFITYLLFFLIGCKNEEVKEHYHPDLKLLPSREEFDHIFRIDQMRSTAFMESMLSQLRAMQPRWQVGVLVGRKEEMFGEIKDVARDSQGRIFVLDSKNAEVRVFDPEGTYLFSIGARGEGPGEWMYPEWIALDEGDTLFVAERRKRIDVFAPAGTRYVYHRTISLLPIAPSGGLCIGDSILIVSGHRARKDTPFIYKISKSGMVLDTLGFIAYKSDNRLVWNYITKNYIACDFKHKIIAVVYRYIPVVQLYHMDTGRLIWDALIENVDISGFWEREGAIYFPAELDKVIFVHSEIFNIGNGIFLFQFISRIKENLDVLIFVFDREGKYLAVNDDYPMLWIGRNSKIVININLEYPNLYYFEK